MKNSSSRTREEWSLLEGDWEVEKQLTTMEVLDCLIACERWTSCRVLGSQTLNHPRLHYSSVRRKQYVHAVFFKKHEYYSEHYHI